MRKQTWEYVEARTGGAWRGCATCNATGTVKRPCPTWADYRKHDRSGCRCHGGEFFDRCPVCGGGGKVRA